MGKYQRTRTGKYMSQPRHPVTGQRMTITADTIPELERKLARVTDVRGDMRLGESIQEAERRLTPVKGVRMTVDECWSRYESGLNRSLEKAQCIWRRRIEPYFGGRSIWELTADVMKGWEAQQRRAGFALATVGLAYDMLAAAVNLQVPSVLPGLPWGKWRPERESKDELYVPKRPMVGTLEAFGQLVRKATDQDAKAWRSGRYSVLGRIVMFLGLMGLRQGEAAGLGWDHVSIDDPNNDLLFVEWQAPKGWWKRHADRPRDTPKDGTRRLRLHPAALQLLRLQREELIRRGWYRSDGPVFPGRDGQWLRDRNVIRPAALKRWARELGLPNADKWCAHSLRHTMVMLEVQACGGDLVRVMQRSGHSDLRVIRGYMHSTGGLLPPSQIGSQSQETRGLEVLVAESAQLPPVMEDPVKQLAASVEVLALTEHARESAAAEREESKRRKRDASYDTLEEIYQRWVDAGKPGKQPWEITDRARRAYVKGYNDGKRKGAPAERCVALGNQARGRFLGAWALALQRLGKVADSSLVKNETNQGAAE